MTDFTIRDLDAALVAKGLIQAGQTVDPTSPCKWVPTGRDGQGKRFLTCTTHGENKVVDE